MVAERKRQRLIARFGASKMWLHLRGRGHDVARCTIERLWSIGSSGRAGQTSCGSRTSPTSLPGPAPSTLPSSSTSSAAGSWAGGPPLG
jgi:hypothetical protein